jgi:hypothetical protein
MGDPRFELSFATAEETLSAGDTRLVDVSTRCSTTGSSSAASFG